MKHLFSTMIVIGIIGLLVAPGLAGDYRHSVPTPFGHGGRAQFVTIEFAHYTQYDVPLWPDCLPQGEPSGIQYIPGLERHCQVTHVPAPPNLGADPGVEIMGDVEGFNVLLSDVFCFNHDFTSARVEAPGYISGILVDTGEPIHMMGRMILDLDTKEVPFEMQGRWVFEKGFGTHYGVLRIKGTAQPENGVFVGRGTYRGWIRENR
jgi:hypothetical protein